MKNDALDIALIPFKQRGKLYGWMCRNYCVLHYPLGSATQKEYWQNLAIERLSTRDFHPNILGEDFPLLIQTRPSEANDASFSDFLIFHFLTTFIFFCSPRPSFLPVPPSSSSLFPPHPSFLLVPPSSSSLFFPRPAVSRSFRIRKRSFFINFDESITNQPNNRRTDRRTRPLIEMRAHLKIPSIRPRMI